MKKCPECSRTYSDETLSFCLEDGALLSASTNFQKTEPLYNAKDIPTVAISEVEVPTRAAQKLAPTVAVNEPEVPTSVADEIPTLVNSSRPDEQMDKAGIGWKVYLAGLFISLIVDLVYNYLLFPLYAKATQEPFKAIMFKFDDKYIGFLVANTLLSTPTFVFVYSLLAFVLGFVWSRGKWKWGIIANIPNMVFTLYYIVIGLGDENSVPTYFIRLFVAAIIYIIAACLSAHIGARLSSKPSA